MSVPPAMMGPPPQGLAQLPPGPPGMGAAPPSDPVSALSATAAGLQQQNEQMQAAATGAMMALAQALQTQASPEAVAAQSSPGPMQAPDAGPQGMPGQ